MSYKFWGMAVRAEQAATLEALRHWPNEQQARFGSCPADVANERGWLVFAVASHGAWTVLSFRHGQGLIPALAIHMSRSLRTRVISVDQNETIGYEHFSVLEEGNVSRCFTLDAGETVESVGVDVMDFCEQAKLSGRVRLPAVLDEDEMNLEVFRIFNVLVSDINVEEIAAAIEGPTFRIWAGEYENRAMATLTNTGQGQGPWWKDLA